MKVVFGANGRAGGETARALIGSGESVRVVLRNENQASRWRELGTEVAIASIDDAQAVTAALAGASAAFVLNPPPVAGDPFAQTEQIGAALAQALRQSRIPKVVALSSVGAQHASGTGVIATLHRLECWLERTAPAIAFLRSGYFVETWSEVADAAITQGVLPTFLDPELKVPTVSTIDVGRTAAQLLGESWMGRRIVELSGPEDWSAMDVAESFSRALGRAVQPARIPESQWAAVFAAQHVPEEVASALMGMYEGISNGLVCRESANEQRHGATSLDTAVVRLVSLRR